MGGHRATMHWWVARYPTDQLAGGLTARTARAPLPARSRASEVAVAGRSPGWIEPESAPPPLLSAPGDGDHREPRRSLVAHRQFDRAEVGVLEVEHRHQVADRGSDRWHVLAGRRVRQVVLTDGGQRAQAPVGLDELEDRDMVVVGVVDEAD